MSVSLVAFVPLAFFGPLGISELVLIGGVALMIFGGRLPEVAMRGAAQVMRARKVVMRMWREAGLEQELRRVQWEIERKMPRETDYELTTPRPIPAPPRTEATPAPAEEASLDPRIGFGAPPGTVAVAPPALAREPDPAPRPPDLPPRDEPAATAAEPPAGPDSTPKGS